VESNHPIAQFTLAYKEVGGSVLSIWTREYPRQADLGGIMPLTNPKVYDWSTGKEARML
jgi:hypothetical protein